MNIQMRDLEELTPYEANARVHPEEQIEFLTKSITRYGFVIPVLITSDNTVIAGHARLEAAKRGRLKYVPCIVKDDWTDAQVMAYNIADNQLAEMSEWDDTNLQRELKYLVSMGVDPIDLGVVMDEDVEARAEAIISTQAVTEEDVQAAEGAAPPMGRHLTTYHVACPDCGYAFSVEA